MIDDMSIYSSCTPTPGEAQGIVLGDKAAMKAHSERVAASRCRPGVNATMAVEEYRFHTRELLETIGKLADGLRSLSAQKTVVLVSEGLYSDSDTQSEFDRIGSRAEAARLRVSSLHVDMPLVEAAYGNTTQTRILDDHLGFDAMSQLADVTGGSAKRAV